jgi:hypothetical protein
LSKERRRRGRRRTGELIRMSNKNSNYLKLSREKTTIESQIITQKEILK